MISGEHSKGGIPVAQVCLDVWHGMLAPHCAGPAIPNAPVRPQYGLCGALDCSEDIGN